MGLLPAAKYEILFFSSSFSEVQTLLKMLDSAGRKEGRRKSVSLAPLPCGNSGISEAELLALQLKMGSRFSPSFPE